MPVSRLRRQSSSKAAALIIVLAFVVLVTGVSLTYFSRTTSERQLAHSSYNDTSADLLTRSALDTVISDFRQEIAFGSTSPAPTFGPAASPGPYRLYVPLNTAYMATQRSGNVVGAPNLIRRSIRSDPMPPPGIASRASTVNSTTDVSNNGRSISAARWNSHYLIPKKNTGTDDSVPIDAFANATPDWVFVTGQGPTILSQPDSSVVGRYAYGVYDVGGLADLNVAGYPTGTTIFQCGRKGALAFADLTAPSPYPIPNGASAAYQIDKLVGWRNYATAQPSNLFPASNFAANFQTDPTRASAYFTFIINNTGGFLTVRSDPSPSPYPWNNRTDQLFLQRQELLAFRATTGFSSNALQHLSTFSREGVVQPSSTYYGAAAGTPQWSPSTPTATNPNFQTLFVTQVAPSPSPPARNDGTQFAVGDYVVNKRFLLQRLNWLTYKGPSATRTIPTSAPPLGDPNYDMWLLTGGNSMTSGLTSAFLLQGTDLSQTGQTGSTANIYKYFGLIWDATNERWNYIGHPATPTAISPPASSIATFGSGGSNDPVTVPTGRELDFFELLQAGIDSNSIGDSLSSDPALPSVHQASKILHILTIGANLITQSRADSYPVRIACNVAGTIMEAIGTPRLPCLSSLAACPIGGTGLGGGVNWLLIPNLWDPFRDTWDLTEANAGNNGNGANLTPGYLRPPVRITIKGNIEFAAANVSQSGSVDPTTNFWLQPRILTGNFNASLTLATGSTVFGRDGLLNGVRLGTTDISDTLTLLDPTESPPLLTTVAQWYRVHPPTNDTSTYRGTPADDYVVFGLRLPGLLILPSSIFQKEPVLAFQPGFQVSLDYQSPNGNWYSYSFLQGNNATTTWISPDPTKPLTIGTSYSEYGLSLAFPPPLPAQPTVINAGGILPVGTPTPWNDVTGALGHAPMFVKADPRSIRYNTTIGVVNVSNPPLSFNSAGVVGPIWPGPYTTPPPMTRSQYPTSTPTPTPSPTGTPTASPVETPNAPNPATLGDNALAGNASNPYSESSGDAWRPVIMNRPFRSVGEMSYAFRDQPFKTLSFSSANSPDAALLDLFTVNDVSDARNPRAGVINLNSPRPWPLAAILAGTVQKENTPRSGSPGAPTPVPLSSSTANSLANNLTALISPAPLKNKGDLANVVANQTTLPATAVPKTEREVVARALGEVDQTRTWNLLIDVVAQTGHFKPNATSLANDFVVEGEERNWVHIAIDRFTGQVIDKQTEVVKE
jgi:hypothetical protein